MRWATAILIWLIAALTTEGCKSSSAPPLQPEAFIAPLGRESGIVTSSTDHNGALVYGQLHAPLLPEEYNELRPMSPARSKSNSPEALADTQPSTPMASPSTLPAAQFSPGTPRTYQLVGTVIAVVNGKPIYADKILASLEQQLAADARRMSPQEFQAEASHKIMERIHASIEDQQYLAAANEFLSPESKANADRWAIIWRIQQIDASGGSEQQAREKALRETGLSLDELVQNTRDQALVQIFLEQRVKPLIQVTASDQRQYYEQHIKDFTQTSEAKFRIIKIDVAKRGGAEDAALVLKKVTDMLRGRTPFEQVSKLYNDDPNDGIVAGGNWVQKGSYVNEEVEDAVWKLTPGEFSEPVRIPRQNAYYIAQLDAKKDGNVQPFEDPMVQARIKGTLENLQFQAIKDSFKDKLIKQAVTNPTPGWERAVMEMVMQRYAIWNPAKS